MTRMIRYFLLALLTVYVVMSIVFIGYVFYVGSYLSENPCVAFAWIKEANTFGYVSLLDPGCPGAVSSN